ncbi:DUF1016 family protein [Mycetohabitans sp. B2]|nr:DUF1016 family protein [Mycetohabitans sp. B2]
MGDRSARRHGGAAWRRKGDVWAGVADAEKSQTSSGKSLLAASGTASSPQFAQLAARFALPWSAYVRLLSVKSPAARAFYESEALRQGGSVRQLDRQISSQLYERLALSRNKVALLDKTGKPHPEDEPTPEEAIRDPFVLEFLDLKDEYSESDLEQALIQHLADFLLELGDDFAFVGRQHRLRIDDSWFRIDLLFFHRRLKCLIVIDLKVGRFTYADAGQMHMYLNYAREHWMRPGENPPVGLILCAQKGAAEAEPPPEGWTFFRGVSWANIQSRPSWQPSKTTAPAITD